MRIRTGTVGGINTVSEKRCLRVMMVVAVVVSALTPSPTSHLEMIVAWVEQKVSRRGRVYYSPTHTALPPKFVTQSYQDLLGLTRWDP